MATIGGRTRLAAVLGHPLGHTLSPAMHNAAYEELGLDWVYVPLEVETSSAFTTVTSAIRVLDFVGFNVTMPYKRDAYEQCDALAHSAELAGAVNTVQVDNGRLIGHNTDGAGLVEALQVDLDIAVAEKTVVVLGAGGAASAAAAGLLSAGAARVVVAARRVEAATDVAQALANRLGDADISGVALDAAREVIASADVVLNATPLGMKPGDDAPVPALWLGPTTACFDMVYGTTHRASFEAAAEQSGCRYAGGLGMLVAQAALAIEIWAGLEPGAAPRTAMRAAAQAELNERISSSQ